VNAPKAASNQSNTSLFLHLVVFLVLLSCFAHLCCFEEKTNRFSLMIQGLTLFQVSHQVFVQTSTACLYSSINRTDEYRWDLETRCFLFSLPRIAISIHSKPDKTEPPPLPPLLTAPASPHRLCLRSLPLVAIATSSRRRPVLEPRPLIRCPLSGIEASSSTQPPLSSRPLTCHHCCQVLSYPVVL
jgi:hypothetical protein